MVTWDSKAIKGIPIPADEVLIIDTEDSRNQKRATLSTTSSTASNVGTGEGFALAKVDFDLTFKSLLGTTNLINLTSQANTVTINVGSNVVQTTGPQTLFDKTLILPTIASFTNAQHDHLSGSEGGTLSGVYNGITGIGPLTQDMDMDGFSFIFSPDGFTSLSSFQTNDVMFFITGPNPGATRMQVTETFVRIGPNVFLDMDDDPITEISYLESFSSPFADAEFLRMGVIDNAAWRNNADDGNLLLGINGLDELQFEGNPIGLYDASSPTEIISGDPPVPSATVGSIDVQDMRLLFTDYTDSANPVRNIVAISAQTVADPLVGSTTVSRMWVNSSGTFSFTDFDVTLDQRDFVLIATASHFDLTNITAISTAFQIATHNDGWLPFDLTEIMGLIKSGMNVSGRGGDTGLDIGTGSVFLRNGNEVDNNHRNIIEYNSATLQPTFAVHIRTGNTIGTPSNTIDPDIWDDGSASPVAVNGGKFTNMRIWMFPSTPLFGIVQLGQTEYGSLEEALAGLAIDSYELNQILQDNDIGLAILTIQEGVTDTDDPLTSKIQNVGKFGFIGGSVGGGSGGNQTPIGQNIDYAGFDQTNVNNIIFQASGATPAINLNAIYATGTALALNTPTGSEISLQINGDEMLDIVVGTIDIKDNDLTIGSGEINVTGGVLGDLLKHTATGFTRFPIGSALQALRVNAGATDLEYATIAGSSPLTTKGDIFTYDTADVRLPVGTDGQILSANPAEATGLEWVDAAAGSGITTLNTLTAAVQTFAVAEADELGISSVTSTHTFSVGANIPRLDETQVFTGQNRFDANAGFQTITGTANPVLIVERRTASTTGFLSAFRVNTVTTGDMTDGFGSQMQFYIEDDAFVSNVIASVAASRDTADDSGMLHFRTNNLGTFTDKMTIDHLGNFDFMGGSFTGVTDFELDGNLIMMFTQADAGAVGPVLRMRNSHGTIAIPTALVINDGLGALAFQGYDSTLYDTGARLNSFATENWGATAHGSDLRFYTVANTTTTISERLRIDNDGSFDFFLGELNNAVLITPTIVDFTNAVHDHELPAGGGTLVATLALTATGTKDSTTFLRGDDTWAVPAGGSGITSINADTTAAQLLANGTGLSLVDAGALHTFSITAGIHSEITGLGVQAQNFNLNNNDLLMGTGTIQFIDANTTITQLSTNMLFDVDLGGDFQLFIDTTLEYDFDAGSTNWNSNDMFNVGELVLRKNNTSATITLDRQSTSTPVDGQIISQLDSIDDTDGSSDELYTQIRSVMQDPTQTNEFAEMFLSVKTDGVLIDYITLDEAGNERIKFNSDVDFSDFNLLNIDNLQFNAAGSTPAATIAYVIYDGTEMVHNVPDTNNHEFTVNGNPVMDIFETSVNLNNVKLANVNPTTITDFTTVVPTSGDFLWIIDVTDGLSKKVDASNFLAGGGGVTSINADFTAAQIMAAGTGLSIAEAGATHTYSITAGIHTEITGLGNQAQTLNMNNNIIDNVDRMNSELVGTPNTNSFVSMSDSELLSWENLGLTDHNTIGFLGDDFEIRFDQTLVYDFTATVFDMNNTKLDGINPTTITDFTTVTPVAGDFLWIIDDTDGLSKKVDASDFLGGGATDIKMAEYTNTDTTTNINPATIADIPICGTQIFLDSDFSNPDSDTLRALFAGRVKLTAVVFYDSTTQRTSPEFRFRKGGTAEGPSATGYVRNNGSFISSTTISWTTTCAVNDDFTISSVENGESGTCNMFSGKSMFSIERVG